MWSVQYSGSMRDNCQLKCMKPLQFLQVGIDRKYNSRKIHKYYKLV